MAFETTHRGNLWTHSYVFKDGKVQPNTKGGRREAVRKGVYVIDHRPTGRFFIGSSNDVTKEVDKHLSLLHKGKHENKFFQRLYQMSDDKQRQCPAPLVIIEYPLNSDKDIKLTLKEIRESNTTPYCLLN